MIKQDPQSNAGTRALSPALPWTLRATLSQTPTSLGSSVLIYKKRGLDHGDNERYLSNDSSEVSRKEFKGRQPPAHLVDIFLPSWQPGVDTLCTKKVDPQLSQGDKELKTVQGRQIRGDDANTSAQVGDRNPHLPEYSTWGYAVRLEFRKTRAKASQSCLTLWDLMDYDLPDSSVHGSLQARMLGSSWPGVKPGSPRIEAEASLVLKQNKKKIIIIIPKYSFFSIYFY